MDKPNSEEWPPYDRPPEVDPAYTDKINKEMLELMPKLSLAATQPANEEIWATVGDLRYGHPLTPLLLRYRALIWMAKNPPDPRGEKMFSRPGPYTMYVRKTDLVDILGYGERTIDRMLAEVRTAIYQKPYGKITVEQFCFIHDLPEDKMQQQLHELVLKRLKKIKRKDE
jgi:hypothetical protein